MATEIEAARLLVLRPRAQGRGRQLHADAAQAKLCRPPAVRAAEEAVQIHGGYGYIEEYPVRRFYRDAKILTIGEGTDEVQHMVIARALGAPDSGGTRAGDALRRPPLARQRSRRRRGGDPRRRGRRPGARPG